MRTVSQWMTATWGGRHKHHGPRTTPFGAGSRDCTCLNCWHWCCGRPCRRVLWSYHYSTIVWFMDSHWNGEKLQDVSLQQYLWESGRTPITIPTSISCFFWLLYHIFIQQRREEISVGSLAGLSWCCRNIPLLGLASIFAAGCWLRQLPEAREVDSHTVWQIECFAFHQWNTQATLLSWGPVNGKTAANRRCSSLTYQACSIPSR